MEKKDENALIINGTGNKIKNFRGKKLAGQGQEMGKERNVGKRIGRGKKWEKNW